MDSASDDMAPARKSSIFLLSALSPSALLLLKSYIIHLVMKKAPENDDAADAYLKIP